MRLLWAALVALGALVLVIPLVFLLLLAKRPPSGSTGREEFYLPIHAVAFCPDGLRVVTLNQGGPVRLWDLATGKELRRFDTRHGVAAVAVSPDGRFLAANWDNFSADEYGTQLWDIATGNEVRRFLGHAGNVYGVAFTPDGRHILSASGDRTVRVWDVVTGREVHCLRGHEGRVNAVAVSPDGRYAFSAGGDYDGGRLHDPNVRLWDLDSGSMIRVFSGHSGAVFDVSVSPDGKLAASASWDGSVRIWDVASGQQTQICEGSPHYEAVAFSPDGRTLLTGASTKYGRVQLWDVATGRELRALGMKTAAYDVAFSPDGKQAISGEGRIGKLPPGSGSLLTVAPSKAELGVAVLWDVASGKELSRIGAAQEHPPH